MEPSLQHTHRLTRAAALIATALAAPSAALAHGFAGQRFFPATIATEDPFVADELSLPTVSRTRTHESDGAPASTQTGIAVDFSKRITPNLGFSIGTAHDRIRFAGQPTVSGMENVELGLKYQFYRDPASESLMSAGIEWEIGGSGSGAVAEPGSTFTPTFYFGKGFGSASSEMLRPFAVTGTVGVAIPRHASTTTTSLDPDTGLTVTDVERNPHVLQLGFAFQYSIPYLQGVVKDVGIGSPWNRMVPVIEVVLQKPLDRVDDRRWTGTINPGVLWAGRRVQFGLEAVLPINRASGRGVGLLAQLHFFLDDIFPQTIGRPLLGGAR
jgi:hypothetical protein